MEKGSKHHLNALVDKRNYREYQYVVAQEGSTVNKYTDKVIRDVVAKWKKKNGVEEFPSEIYE